MHCLLLKKVVYEKYTTNTRTCVENKLQFHLLYYEKTLALYAFFNHFFSVHTMTTVCLHRETPL